MKKLFFLIFVSTISYSQISSSFSVGGDNDKFYPVTFYDGGWANNVPTNLILGRSIVHTDSSWRGSLISVFNFHVSGWGNGSEFIDAEIIPSISNYGSYSNFIAGWKDVSILNSERRILIWLRGGTTTYYYQSNYAVNPVVYDGIQNVLPYNEVNGPVHNYKTTVEEYATTTGTYQIRNAYFKGNVGIGTTKATSKLTVAGNIASREVKVTVDAGAVPDYVFENNYRLKTLQEVEYYIKENKHLPEIPSAKQIEKDGLMLAEMNMALLKKIEEMTLYLIDQNRRIDKLEKEKEKK